jgi:hypothetical protein
MGVEIEEYPGADVSVKDAVAALSCEVVVVKEGR